MRKVSSHRSVLVHFHDDGEVCPQSFGQSCPFGDIEGPLEPASPSFLSKLPNGFNFSNLVSQNINGHDLRKISNGGGLASLGAGTTPDFSSFIDDYGGGGGYDGGGGGYDGGSGGFDGGGGGGTGNGQSSFQSNSSTSNFDASGFMDDLTASLDLDTPLDEDDVAPNSLVISNGNSAQANASIANMAKMAITSGTPSAVAAMAKMAAAQGNMKAAKAIAQMAQVAATNGIKTLPPQAIMAIMAKTGLGGSEGMVAAAAALRKAEASNKDNKEKQIEAQKYVAVMQKQAASVQMSKTIANSSLAKQSDQQTKKMTEGKFSTTKEFIDYMQSPDTEVNPFACRSIPLGQGSSM